MLLALVILVLIILIILLMPRGIKGSMILVCVFLHLQEQLKTSLIDLS